LYFNTEPKIRPIREHRFVEYEVLLNIPERDLRKIVDAPLVKTIIACRKQNINMTPGFDGEYGKPKLSWVQNK
jgi:PHP family Zn ribbon phosphoesterase